jgi:membrane protein required for colicin V production
MALDVTLIVIMLISAFLAMVRGFMREVLSVVGWVVAAGAAGLAYLRLTGPVLQFFTGANEMLVKAATVFTVAIVALIVVTYLTTRISDKILDSKIGALDRTLGVLFGLARGLLLVAVAFGFYHWFFIKDGKEDDDPYTRNAKSRGVLLATDAWIESYMPPNLEKMILDFLNSLKNGNKPPNTDTGEAQPTLRSRGAWLRLPGGESWHSKPPTTEAAAETRWRIRGTTAVS